MPTDTKKIATHSKPNQKFSTTEAKNSDSHGIFSYMLKFEFSDSDCKIEYDDADCQSANITMKWRGGEGDVDTMLLRFKSFLLAMTFCESNVRRIVYLDDDEWALLRAKGLLQDGEDPAER